MQEKERKFAPGFRLNLLDVFILLFGIASAFYIKGIKWELSLIIVTVVFHFFLFCNVFRITRMNELIWAAAFLVLMTLTIVFGIPGWMTSVILSLVFSGILISKEVKSPQYHGILWSKFNPNLREWWEKNLKA